MLLISSTDECRANLNIPSVDSCKYATPTEKFLALAESSQHIDGIVNMRVRLIIVRLSW